MRLTLNVSTTTDHPRCPSCHSSMLIKTARRGSHAGDRFWGCSRYPQCEGLVPIDQDAESILVAPTASINDDRSNSEYKGETEFARKSDYSSFDDTQPDISAPAPTVDEILSRIDAHISEFLNSSITMRHSMIDRRRNLIAICKTQNPEQVIKQLRSAVAIGRDAISFEPVEQVIEQLTSDVRFVADHFFRAGPRQRPPMTWNDWK